LRFIAHRDACRTIAHREATPALRRDRQDHHRTKPAEPVTRRHANTTSVASTVRPMAKNHGNNDRPGVVAGASASNQPIPVDPRPVTTTHVRGEARRR
jgi:hypothetical protein